MKLSEFIRENHACIVQEWEKFAATLLPAAGGMNALMLRDHAEAILSAIVEDLESPQDDAEQEEKSKGRGEEHRMQAVGKTHAAIRIEDGFKLIQLVAEYRALRASVLNLFRKAVGHETVGGTDLRQVTRFNEAIDEALVEATNRYMLVLNRTSDQFLAVLGHDLRNPLGAISMSAAVISRRGEDKSAKAASLILTSAERMKRMVHDLLDLTRTRLGSGIPIAPKPMDLEALCREVVAELEAFHPQHRLEVECEGDLHGTWDADRLAQALSNLVGNAVQHGAPQSPIDVAARAEADGVTIEIHNEGSAIPKAQLANIFEPMVREPADGDDGTSTSLGLGLHIAREIVLAHGGAVTVASTEKAGTTFSIRLPRHSVAAPRDARKRKDEHDASGELVAAEGEVADHSRGGLDHVH